MELEKKMAEKPVVAVQVMEEPPWKREAEELAEQFLHDINAREGFMLLHMATDFEKRLTLANSALLRFHTDPETGKLVCKI